MSDQWHGGKGSKDRTGNFKAYWNSPLWDKKTPSQESRILFLDDERDPENAYLWDEKYPLVVYSGIPAWKWDVVRSYEEFVEYIEEKGIPTVVSFDNDLFNVADPDLSDETLDKQFLMDGWQDFSIKTGAHCAQYLVKACKARNVTIPKYYVHSANNAARPIIREIMETGKSVD